VSTPLALKPSCPGLREKDSGQSPFVELVAGFDCSARLLPRSICVPIPSSSAITRGGTLLGSPLMMTQLALFSPRYYSGLPDNTSSEAYKLLDSKPCCVGNGQPLPKESDEQFSCLEAYLLIFGSAVHRHSVTRVGACRIQLAGGNVSSVLYPSLC
jgi:hypothetical protein